MELWLLMRALYAAAKGPDNRFKECSNDIVPEAVWHLVAGRVTVAGVIVLASGSWRRGRRRGICFAHMNIRVGT